MKRAIAFLSILVVAAGLAWSKSGRVTKGMLKQQGEKLYYIVYEKHKTNLSPLL